MKSHANLHQMSSSTRFNLRSHVLFVFMKRKEKKKRPNGLSGYLMMEVLYDQA